MANKNGSVSVYVDAATYEALRALRRVLDQEAQHTVSISRAMAVAVAEAMDRRGVKA